MKRRVSAIKCTKQNHREMLYEYVCLNKICVGYGDELCCFYCCDENHGQHKSEIIAIRQLVSQLQQKKRQTEFNLLQILLKGIGTCRNYEQFKSNIEQLLSYRADNKKYEYLVDQQMRNIQANTCKYYQRIRQAQTLRTVTERSTLAFKQFIRPILSFKEHPSYILKSPFCITNKNNDLITAFAYPSLSKLAESIDIKIKINRYTPNWLAVGLSLGQNKYEEQSSRHILAISNGWISNCGKLSKSSVRFGGGDCVSVKWDKNKQLVQVGVGRCRQTLRLLGDWRQQIFLCVCLFSSGDSVSILS